MIKNLTKKDYEKFTNTAGISVVDFYATWCGPCKNLEPILNEVSNEHDYIDFYKVNVDDENELAMLYGIRNLPTVMFFRDGVPLNNKVVGITSKDTFNDIIKNL